MKSNWLGRAAGAAASLLVAGAASADGMARGSLKDAADAPCCTAHWSGLYIGGAVGYGIATTDVDVNHQYWSYDETYWEEPTHLLSVNGLSAKGVTGTVSIGYDREVRPGLVLGLFGDYTFGDLDASAAASGEYRTYFDMRLSDQWAVGARIGLVRSCCTMWYALAGYTEGDLSFSVDVEGELSESGGHTLKGYFLGLGVEQQLGRDLSLKLEYRFTDFGAARLGSYLIDDEMERINIKADTDVHSIRLGLNWKLDLLHRAEAPVPLK